MSPSYPSHFICSISLSFNTLSHHSPDYGPQCLLSRFLRRRLSFLPFDLSYSHFTVIHTLRSRSSIRSMSLPFAPLFFPPPLFSVATLKPCHLNPPKYLTTSPRSPNRISPSNPIPTPNLLSRRRYIALLPCGRRFNCLCNNKSTKRLVITYQVRTVKWAECEMPMDGCFTQVSGKPRCESDGMTGIVRRSVLCFDFSLHRSCGVQTMGKMVR